MAGPEETRPIWQEIAKLGDRQTLSERALDRHLGQCEERHKEIIRRHEDSARERSTMRENFIRDIADVKRSFEKDSLEVRRAMGRGLAWVIGLLVTALGGMITFIAGIVTQAIKLS